MTFDQLMNEYRCDQIKADHCEARDFVKECQLMDVLAGQQQEPVCQRICCIGCPTRCGWVCGRADNTVRELRKIYEEYGA